MPRGIATATCSAAQAVGLNDRGTISIGARADLIRFATLHGTPVLKETWCHGVRVF
jgi:alpha-D-ribose 1-methylphosphonate 5-triphosphate diphosphatase